MSLKLEKSEGKTRPEVKKRIPINGQDRMAVGTRYQKEGFQLYWMLTGLKHEGDMLKFQDAGWTPVLEDGKQIILPGGGGVDHVLMEIPQEWYDEEMARQAAVRQRGNRKAYTKQTPHGYIPNDNGRETNSAMTRDLF